jgi:hypothetical protein
VAENRSKPIARRQTGAHRGDKDMKYASILLAAFAVVASLAIAADAPPRELSVLDSTNRYLEKDFPATKRVPSTTIIDSFEDWAKTKPNWLFNEYHLKPESTAEHATDGKSALKVTFVHPGDRECALCYREGTSGWGSPEDERKAALSARVLFNDEMRVDIFNPGEPVTLLVTVGRELGEAGSEFKIPLVAGKNEVVLKTADLIADRYRATVVLNSTWFGLVEKSDKPVTLYFDNFRWVGPGIGENLIKQAKCFDFGSESYCRPYFQNVDSTTGYTKERGFGWEKPGKVVFEYVNNIVTQTSTGRQPHDELLRDNVFQINTPFLMDLPDGRYRIHLVEGAAMGWYTLHQARYDLNIVANGKTVLTRRAAKTPAQLLRCYYGLDQTDYEPGENKFLKYMSPDVYPLEFDVDVKGGQLKLEFNTEPLNNAQVSFMIVYPVDKAAAVEPEIASLWRDIVYRFNEMSYSFIPRKMAEQMHVPGLHEEYLAPEVQRQKIAALKPTAQDQARGFMVFTREPVDDVYPDSVPSPAECGKPFVGMAPQGEIVSFAPAIHALKKVDDVTFNVGQFVGPAGAKIAAGQVDVRVVNCMYRMSGQQTHGDWRYVVMPWYLVKRDKLAVAAGTSRRFWVNVDVPPDTAPGRYVATATISAKGAAPVQVPLTLDVLPFKLDAIPADVEVAMYTGIEGHWYQHPFTGGFRFHISWRPWSTPEKKAEMDTQLAEQAKLQKAGLKAEFDLLRRYGFNTLYQWRPDADMTPELTAGLKVVPAEEEMKKIHPQDVWPPPQVHKADHRKRAFIYDLAALNETTAQDFRKQGYEVEFNWINAWEDLQQEGGLNRFESGVFMWRLGAKGIVHNPWKCSWGNPYSPFDGHSGEWGSYCMPASGPWPTLNPSVVLEGAREGLQDYRWLITLERLIKDKAGTPAATAAQKHIEELKQKIAPDAKTYFQGVGLKGSGWGQTWSQKDTAWKGEDYRQERQKLAALIADLLGKEPSAAGR